MEARTNDQSLRAFIEMAERRFPDQVVRIKEKVTFNVQAGKNYFFVVDGYNGAVSPYSVAVTSGCP